MKIAIFMRHGKSSWADIGQPDHDRPLKPRGVQAARAIGRHLEENHLKPDLILCSTALRAKETCENLLDEVKWDTEVRYLPELYLAPSRRYQEILAGQPDELQRVLVIGHNPGLEELVSELGGEFVDFPTAATAVFEVTADGWSQWQRAQPIRQVHLWLPRKIEG